MWEVVYLGADGKIRTEVFEDEKEANSVAQWIKEFYGNPMVKVRKKEEN